MVQEAGDDIASWLVDGLFRGFTISIDSGRIVFCSLLGIDDFDKKSDYYARSITMRIKERNPALDMLRFVATLAIFNHLAQRFYGKYAFLATGGVIGCSLFFFCSGFLMACSGERPFGVLIKNRLARILPTCFLAATIRDGFGYVGGRIVWCWIGGGNGWFLQCLILYSVAYWMILKASRSVWREIVAIAIVSAGCILLYAFSYKTDTMSVTMFGDNYFRWSFFGLFFLLGAYASHTRPHPVRSLGRDMFLLTVSIFAFYSYYFFAPHSRIMVSAQIGMLMPLVGIVWFAFKCCGSRQVECFMQNRLVARLVAVVGGLSLEMYLLGRFATSFVPQLRFPVGYLLGMAAAVSVAYLTRALGRLFAQTFDRSSIGYDLRKAFLL